MKTQLMIAIGASQQNLRDVHRSPRLAALRPSRSRLALESLETRALLTAIPAFASCEWKDTLPESYWMATCQANCAPTAAESRCNEQPECAETVKVRGGGATVCVDSKPVCEEQEVNCVEQEECWEEQDCTPTPPCDSAPPTECWKSDCEDQPTPQARQAVFEKIARLLRSVGIDCEYEYEECETPKTVCESSEKQSRDNRCEPSCNDNTPQSRDERQCETQERRGQMSKTELCQVVERCLSDRGWSDAVARARFR